MTGKVFECKVIEVNLEQIGYRLSDSIVSEMRNDEIWKIVYKNGTEDLLNKWGPYKKNVILLNGIEIFDGALSFSYSRISYRYATITRGAVSFGSGSDPKFSNGILTEKSKQYQMTDKPFDISAALDRNLPWDKRSFGFVGLKARMARFAGYYAANYTTRYNFNLHKYYVLANVGFLARGKRGLSFLMDLDIGHYFNDYQEKKEYYMYNDYFNRDADALLNSFNFSMQIGYSF
jgi:hypothetical protein